MRLTERECGRSRQKCRSEKENERIVPKMHKGQPVITKQGKTEWSAWSAIIQDGCKHVCKTVIT